MNKLVHFNFFESFVMKNLTKNLLSSSRESYATLVHIMQTSLFLLGQNRQTIKSLNWPLSFFAEIRDAQFLKRLVLGGPGSIFKLLNFRVFPLFGKNFLGS